MADQEHLINLPEISKKYQNNIKHAYMIKSSERCRKGSAQSTCPRIVASSQETVVKRVRRVTGEQNSERKTRRRSHSRNSSLSAREIIRTHLYQDFIAP